MSHSPDSHHEIAVPVDRVRAEALRARLHAELDRRGPTSPTPRTMSAESQEFQMSPSLPSRPARRTIAWAAAAVTAVGLAGVVAVAATRDDSPQSESPPSPTSPSTTSSTSTSTTTSTTTVPAPASPDERIAELALPTPVPEVYGEGWQTVGGMYPVEMRGDVAAETPECVDFAAAFESPGRAATIDAEMAWKTSPAALAATYIVVFPEEAPAVEMFAAVSNPRFIGECVPRYLDQLIEMTGQSRAPLAGQSYFPFFGDGMDTPAEAVTRFDHPDFDLAVDDQWRLEQFYPSTGERFQTTAIRIGRVVAIVQGISEALIQEYHADGTSEIKAVPLMTDSAYGSVVRVVADDARKALELAST